MLAQRRGHRDDEYMSDEIMLVPLSLGCSQLGEFKEEGKVTGKDKANLAGTSWEANFLGGRFGEYMRRG